MHEEWLAHVLSDEIGLVPYLMAHVISDDDHERINSALFNSTSMQRRIVAG